ncbi:MAG: tripartite tricarboxylate transporter substrate binding protein [Hyphomicrobiaceae bacterium]|nr:tripartite tricarboxylate transporter substrate binding protein [Hyphomicrobiaceae bacterium]
MISSRWLRLAAVSAAAVLFGLAGRAEAAFPDRPITLVVPWAAGGGTDAIARYIAASLQEDLGQPVNVVNRTGGNGVIGHSAIATALPDGYTIGLITLEINMMHWMGLTDLTHESYTPLALINADPAAIHVRTDSEYKTLGDLVAVIKANPGKLKSSGTGQGGSWHLALAGMLHSMGVDPNSTRWVPSTGAATALTDLAAGGVDFVSCSLPEARALMDAGRVRSLAFMSDKRSAVFPTVPTLKEASGSSWTKGVWRGMVGPKGLPPDIAKRYEALFKKVHESAGFQKFMSDRGFETLWGDSTEFAAFMKRDNGEIGEMMKLMGLAK